MANGTPENLSHSSSNKNMYIKVKKRKYRCKQCGVQVSQNAQKCWSCGAKVSSSQNNVNVPLLVGILIVAVFLLSKLG